MSRFLIEHLPRVSATYVVTPLSYGEMKAWLHEMHFISIIRTTELISAIETDAGIKLAQSDVSLALMPGDQALLVTLSYGVLLAWAEGNIAPLPEDWRCLLLNIATPQEPSEIPAMKLLLPDDFLSEQPT